MNDEYRTGNVENEVINIASFGINNKCNREKFLRDFLVLLKSFVYLSVSRNFRTTGKTVDKYALTDVFFPQFGIHVEINEPPHYSESRIIADKAKHFSFRGDKKLSRRSLD